MLSLSILGFFAARFTVLAVPFLDDDGAARFLLLGGCGFSEDAAVELSTVIGEGVWFVSLLISVKDFGVWDSKAFAG